MSRAIRRVPENQLTVRPFRPGDGISNWTNRFPVILGWSLLILAIILTLTTFSFPTVHGPLTWFSPYSVIDITGNTSGDLATKHKWPSLDMSSGIYQKSALPETQSPHAQEGSSYKIVCYYGMPRSESNLQPEELDPFLCTHINVAFARVRNLTLVPDLPKDIETYKKVLALRSKNPNLKVLLSIGGYSRHGGFPDMVATRKRRFRFLLRTITFLEELGFDGVDFDWEFPSWNGPEIERFRFTYLLEHFRKEFTKRNSSMLLTVAVGAPKTIVDTCYETRKLARLVDFINLMSYDYHYYLWYLPMTGMNAPVYKRENEVGLASTLNTNWSSYYWVENGMPKEKVIVGIPAYGHTYTLSNAENNGIGAPASGIGSLGSGGFINYPDLCKFLYNGSTRVFDTESMAPYAYNGMQWVSYDDVPSVTFKAEYVRNNSFGGAMILSLDSDDFQGKCLGYSFPLSKAVKGVLGT